MDFNGWEEQDNGTWEKVYGRGLKVRLMQCENGWIPRVNIYLPDPEPPSYNEQHGRDENSLMHGQVYYLRTRVTELMPLLDAWVERLFRQLGGPDAGIEPEAESPEEESECPNSRNPLLHGWAAFREEEEARVAAASTGIRSPEQE